MVAYYRHLTEAEALEHGLLTDTQLHLFCSFLQAFLFLSMQEKCQTTQSQHPPSDQHGPVAL